MFGQTGNTSNGPVQFDKFGDYCAIATFEQDSAANAEVSIEPAMPHPTSIRFNTNLKESICGALRDRLNAQARRVGMGSDHANRVAGLPFCADCEGDDSRRVSGEVVLAAGLKGAVPGVSLL